MSPLTVLAVQVSGEELGGTVIRPLVAFRSTVSSSVMPSSICSSIISA